MKQEEKQGIVDSAIAYMKEKGLSQNEFCKLTGVNASYMSAMTNGVFTFRNTRTGKDSPIGENWFFAIANKIGYAIQKEYWPLVETPQFIDITYELTEARKTATTRMLIGEPGCGKTYTVRRFAKAYPQDTFIVTCYSVDKAADLLRKIQDAMRCSFKGSSAEKIDRIAMEFDRMHDRGQSPTLIFDEAENLKLPALGEIKSIYDQIEETRDCSIVLIGTDQLLRKLKKSEKKDGIPQFIRRFEPGLRCIRPMDKTYAPFLVGRGYSPELCSLLRNNARDYGDLAKKLEPALRAADEKGIPLTAQLFKSITFLNK